MMPRARALHARVSVFASVLVTLVATLSCATQTKVTRLTPGTYQLECKDSLAVCLVAARELCREYGYDVISGTERRDYIEQEPQGYESVKANATVRCLVMVESVGALADVDEIAATPGVDGLFVGPFDLALALGSTVDALLDDRSDGNPLGRVVAAAQRHGILVAGFAGTPVNAQRLRAHGIRCLAVTTDLALVTEGARATLAADHDA